MIISKGVKTITKSTVEGAYKEIIIKNNNREPWKLDVVGDTYLYPEFVRLGAIGD